MSMQKSCWSARLIGCSHKFDVDYVFKLRYQMNALSADTKSMFLLGKIASSGVRSSGVTEKSKRAHQTARHRKRIKGYSLDGIRVCRDAFLFMHMISDKFLTKLVSHYSTYGIEVPQKAAGGARNNKKAFSAEDVIQTVTYITNYAEMNGMVIPGRVAGVKTADPRVRLLPSSDNKTRLWRGYKKHFEDLNRITGTNFRIVQRSSFHKIWKLYTPFVLTTQPRTDLCWTCQRHNRHIYQSANEVEDEKRARLIKQQEHLRLVDQERGLYRQHVKDAKDAVDGKGLVLGVHAPCSMQGSINYSFDFAQQVHYPNDPDQPGPMYFLTPRKCAVFGINCEASPKQVNFLIDEGMSISKGSIAVISYLHFFFNNYGLGEETAQLHCDNCSGQNKNKFMMWYLAWRCIHGLHKSIELYFLIAGHTKFSPDWCFGLFKQRYRRSHITALCDIQEAVRTSSHQEINIPQLVGTEDGQVLVESYNWQDFLAPYFKPLPKIKSYHHMRFDSEHHGMVFAKCYADSEEVSFQLLKNPAALPPLQLPQPVTPPGLPEERIRYLYNSIRQFCAQDHRADLTCPVPEGH